MPSPSLPRGWRGSILSGSLLCTLVFLLNISLTIYSSSYGNSSDSPGRKVLYSGDCETSRKINVGLHLLINILSTILLAASNYGMQCLSAPTRGEVDRAHGTRKWLDVGVLSWRNLRWIGRKRLGLWMLLVGSSLPLHLFFNSAVYSSIYAMDYMVFMATEDMLKDPDPFFFLLQTGSLNDTTALSMYESARSDNLTRLSNEDCMNAYATTFNTRQGNLILVVNITRTFSYQYISNQTIEIPPIAYGDGVTDAPTPDPPCVRDPFGWICGNLHYEACPDGSIDNQPGGVPVATQVCSVSSIDPENWSPFGTEVEYCLTEDVAPRCKVQFVPVLAYIVICFNFVKALVLVYVVFCVKEDPLLTMGDAVASFLEERDESTWDLCLLDKKHIKWWAGDKKGVIPRPYPRPLDIKPKRWSSAVSTSRWASTLSIYTFVLLGLLGLILAIQLYFHPLSFSKTLALGLGAVDPLTFIGWSLPSTGSDGLIANVILANIAQPILSSLYYAYNALFTTIMMGVEWNSFSRERKGLRVSSIPKGAQRESYKLQLPFRWAGPLMILSGVLHWLLSQSLFVVSIEFDHTRLWSDGDDVTSQYFPQAETGPATSVQEYITCGYSISAVLGALVVGAVALVLVVGVGWRRLESSGMPVVGSCSAAISACCRLKDGSVSSVVERPKNKGWSGRPECEPLEQGENGSAAYERVMWGEVGEETPIHDSRWAGSEAYDSSLMVGHCSFSGGDVQKPREGVLYA